MDYLRIFVFPVPGPDARPQFVVILYLPIPVLNLCLPVLRFTIKVFHSYSTYFYKRSVLLICTYFLSIMWEISKS